VPRRNAARTSTSAPESEAPLDRQIRRVANLLALLLVKGESQPEKIRVLNAVGYANAEIAELLGMTPNAVTVSLYQQRKRK
jgi:hypothetical protein